MTELDYEEHYEPADPAETDEQRADRLETERNHAAGNHESCRVTCETEFTTEKLRNGILARAIPGSKAMLNELLRRARAEGRQQPATTPPAPADGDLRDGSDGYGPPVHWTVYNDMHKRASTAEAETKRMRAGWAGVMREAAMIAEGLRQFEHATGARKAAQISENVGVLRVADELRRMADEAQQADTPREAG